MKLNFFGYIGGKSYMLKEILSFMDYTKRCYIELFLGGGSVFFNKKPHRVEIINDKNQNLINLYKIVKCYPRMFIRELNKYCYSRDTFYLFKEKFKKNDFKNEVEKAVVFYYLYNCSFSGNILTFSIGFCKNKAKIFFNKIKKLDFIISRLQNAQIENRDYKEILESIENKEDVIIYADPPYYNTEYYYNMEFDKNEHLILAKLLNKVKCKVILSYYYFQDIERLYPEQKWQYNFFKKTKFGFGITKKNNNVKIKPKAEELILTNFKKEKNLLGE